MDVENGLYYLKGLLLLVLHLLHPHVVSQLRW